MRFSWIAVSCLWLSCAAGARPYTVEDVLKLQSYGQAQIVPGGSLAIVERRDAYDEADNYSYSFFVRRLLSKLYAVDLAGEGSLSPLFEQQPDAGYWMGSFSPSGRQLTIFRLYRDELSLGVLDLETRRVRWLPETPDLPLANPAPIWLDEQRLVYSRLKPGALPLLLGFGSGTQKRSHRAWARQQAGTAPSEMVFGSGRFAKAGIDDEGRAVLLSDLRNGKTRTLFEGQATDLALSSDGSSLAVVHTSDPVRLRLDRPITGATAWRRQRLAIIDMPSGQVWQACSRCDVIGNLLAWSPTGAELLIYARGDGQEWREGQLYRIDPAAKRTAALTDASVRPVFDPVDDSLSLVRAAWVGRTPIMLAKPAGAGGGAAWYKIAPGATPRPLTTQLAEPAAALIATLPRSFAVGVGTDLWNVDLEGRASKIPAQGAETLQPVTDDFFSLGIRHFLNTPSTSLPFRIGRSGSTTTRKPDATSERGATACLVPASTSILAANRQRELALGYSSGPDGVGRLMALACGKPPRLLETINPHLAGIDPARAVPLETVSATGELLTHWLYLPAAGDKKTPPLVVVPYPGMGFAEDLPPGPPLNAIQTAANPQLLAGHGYAVLRPAIPLSPGTGDPMARLHHEVQKAIDVAIATGRVDGSRVAVYGHSYGGYGALALATLSNRFSAVIGSAGVFDLASNYGDQFDGAEDGERTAMLPSIAAGWAESGQGRMGSPPWRDLDRYVRNSPYYRVERITSPVLLIHGDVDAVPVEQAERMFFALYRSGADALFVRYGGEGHALTSPANIRDSWRRIFSFLDEALAQDPPRTLPSRP